MTSWKGRHSQWVTIVFYIHLSIPLFVILTTMALRQSSSPHTVANAFLKPALGGSNISLSPRAAIAVKRPSVKLVSGRATSTNSDSTSVRVVVHPLNAPVTSKVTRRFTAVVTGPANEAVNWYVDGVLGGNSDSGRIDPHGLYMPPESFVAGTHQIQAVSQADPTKSGKAAVYLVDNPGVYTNRNDNSRTGQNLLEKVLTQENVSVTSFGKLFTFRLDSGTHPVHAQPLYVANLYVPHPEHGVPGYYNVVYVASDHDSVFAFDADGQVRQPLWKISFIHPPDVVPVPGSCFGASVPEFGITATPVIDPATNTMYVEARTLENRTTECDGTYVHKLHALDVATGHEKFGGPMIVKASVHGTGVGSHNGVVKFNPKSQNARPGLLLSRSSRDANNIVYFATASIRDQFAYHGWVLGYDSQTLAQQYVYNSTPNGAAGGIWHMGGGLPADDRGKIFAQTGNGSVRISEHSYSQAVLKLAPSSGGRLSLADYFIPRNYNLLNTHDWDVSSGGLLLLPDQPGKHRHLMVGGGKEGTIYVIDRDNLGKFNSGGDNIVQEIVGAIRASDSTGVYGIWNTPGYFQDGVYIFGHYDYPKMFKLRNGVLPDTATTTGNKIMKSPSPTFSADGANNGIVWILECDVGRLWAFDPNDLTHEFYDTNQNSDRDKLDGELEAVTPTVANGRVYVPTHKVLAVYGLVE